jgi:hypothetical protein
MSNITYTTIQTGYPIAGQDNDSQGFRDNFSAITLAIQTAKAEIEALQTQAVLKTNLSDFSLPVDNSLGGSTILNGSYNNFHSVAYVSTISEGSAIVVDITNGESQTFIVNEGITSSSVSILFQNWPEAGFYGKVRVQIKMTQDTPANRSLSPIGTTAGSIRKPTTFPSPLVIHASGKYQIIEAWSNDNGANVFLNYLGEY